MGNGGITIGRFRTKVQLSTALAFPAALGWFRFEYGPWWYYIRAVGRGIQVFRFSVKPNSKCRKVYNGMKNFCGVSNGGRAPVYTDNSCAGVRANVLAGIRPGSVGAYIPSCKPDGTYKTTHCHGSTGFCWCVNSKGKEIK